MRYWEDIQVGDHAAYGNYQVTREDVLDFAGKFDPQPFHLDDAAAAETHFGRLAASGWHTCAMTMAMHVAHWSTSGEQSGGLGAAGIDELRWLKPVYPGDTLRCETSVEETRASNSRPDMGSARTRTTVFNQHDEPVLRFIAIGLWRRRPAEA
jgi:acyl dehydratase